MNRSSRLPVTEKIAGSIPVGPATFSLLQLSKLVVVYMNVARQLHMYYYFYILRSQKNEKLYLGYTPDLKGTIEIA